MSLYKDASLAMIPSAYKDGKLYSIRPTDGSGDFTFSRGSNLAATRVDVNGLIEKGRENLVPHSNTFSSWNATALLNTPSTGITGYDGSNNAWKIIPNTTNTSHRVWYPSLGLGDSVYTFSVYAKSGGYSSMYLYCNSTGADFAGWFDLSAGTTGSGTGRIDTTISDVGNGWYRCTLTGLEDISSLEMYVGDGTESIVFAGDGTSSLYIQDAQLEQGLVATDYIETGASTAQAGILEDMPRLDYSGGASCPSLLLEPQRTNLMVQSEYFGDYNVKANMFLYKNNNVLSPEGVYNGWYATRNINTSGYVFTTNTILSPSTTYTYSIWLKAADLDVCDSVVLSLHPNTFSPSKTSKLSFIDGTATGDGIVEPYPNGWYRISLTGTTASSIGYFDFGLQPYLNGSSNWGGSDGDTLFYAYGQQVEQGSYPTSYIPTYGSSVTRLGDFSSNIGVLGTSYSSNDFTYFIEFDLLVDSADYTPMLFGGGNQALGSSYQGYLRIGLFGNNSIALFGHGDVLMDSVISPLTKDTRYKLLVKRSGTSIQFYLNGAQIGTTGTSSLDFTLRSVGWSYAAGSYNTFGNIYQFLGFETALTDAECIALTTL